MRHHRSAALNLHISLMNRRAHLPCCTSSSLVRRSLCRDMYSCRNGRLAECRGAPGGWVSLCARPPAARARAGTAGRAPQRAAWHPLPAAARALHHKARDDALTYTFGPITTSEGRRVMEEERRKTGANDTSLRQQKHGQAGLENDACVQRSAGCGACMLHEIDVTPVFLANEQAPEYIRPARNPVYV